MKTKSNKSTGRRTVTPIAPTAPAFQPQAPTFPTVTLMFEGLPSVALIVPDPTNWNDLIRIGAEVSRQCGVKAVEVVAGQLAQQQPPARILGPDEPGPA